MTANDVAYIVRGAESTLKAHENRSPAKSLQNAFRTLTEVPNGVTEVCNDTMPRMVWVRFTPRITAEQREQIDNDRVPTNRVSHVIKFKSSRYFPCNVKALKQYHKHMIVRAWNLYALEQMEKVPCYASADVCQTFDDLLETYYIQIFW